MSDELFDLGDGLPLSDANATIVGAEFRFDTEYSADAVVLAFTFQPDEDGVEEQTQLYSVGKNFEPLDGGSEVGHTSGKHVKISKQSNYGKFMRAAQECEGFADVARELGANTHAAEWWIGTRWHLTTEEFEVKNPSKPDQPAKIRTIIIPDEFLGLADGEDGDDGEEASEPASRPAKKAAAKKGAAKKKVAAKVSNPLDELAEQEGGEELIQTLRDLADTCEDHESFMEAAMDVDGVAGNSAAEKAILSTKPGSIWQDAVDAAE